MGLKEPDSSAEEEVRIPQFINNEDPQFGSKTGQSDLSGGVNSSAQICMGPIKSLLPHRKETACDVIAMSWQGPLILSIGSSPIPGSLPGSGLTFSHQVFYSPIYDLKLDLMLLMDRAAIILASI